MLVTSSWAKVLFLSLCRLSALLTLTVPLSRKVGREVWEFPLVLEVLCVWLCFWMRAEPPRVETRGHRRPGGKRCGPGRAECWTGRPRAGEGGPHSFTQQSFDECPLCSSTVTGENEPCDPLWGAVGQMRRFRSTEEGAPDDTGGGRGCFWGEVRLGRSQPGGRGAGGQALQIEHGVGGGGWWWKSEGCSAVECP